MLKKVVIVSDNEVILCKKEAFELVKDIDEDDVIFVACALAYPDSYLWSDDKRLKMHRVFHHVYDWWRRHAISCVKNSGTPK